MIKYKKNCAVCKLARVNKKLAQRIYDSRYFVPYSEDTLLQIHADWNQKEKLFSYQSLLNHVKKHQFINAAKYQEKVLEEVDRKAEQKTIQKAIRATDAVQGVIEKGYQRLEDGEINVSTNDLLRASQIKIGQENKEKDQQLAILEMIASFASGSQKSERIIIDADLDEEINDYDPTTPVTPYN